FFFSSRRRHTRSYGDWSSDVCFRSSRPSAKRVSRWPTQRRWSTSCAMRQRSSDMAVLVVAEHDNKAIRKSTLNAVAAAQKLGGELHMLVAGHEAGDAAKAAAQIAGVAKVLHADAPHLGEFLAENVAALVVSLAKSYSHILAPSTSNGKNVLPRAAALLDMQQISDIVAVDSADTFVRPIY